jgi:hypothetical protein
MRINTKIDDQLHQALNVHRATMALTVREVVERALHDYLDHRRAPEQASHVATAKGAA